MKLNRLILRWSDCRRVSDQYIWKRIQRKTGFTLVEMLVVLAIISVLLAMLMPALKGAKESARAVVCINNQKQIVTAFLVYANENNSRLPPYGKTPSDSTRWWWELVRPILAPKSTGIIGKFQSDYGIRCPSALDSENYSYGVNWGFVGSSSTYVFSYESAADPQYPGSKFLHELSPTTMLVSDASRLVFYNPSPGGAYTLDVDLDNDTLDDSNNAVYGVTGKPYNGFWPRHSSGRMAVGGFADGSCRKVTLRDWSLNQDKLWGPQ